MAYYQDDEENVDPAGGEQATNKSGSGVVSTQGGTTGKVQAAPAEAAKGPSTPGGSPFVGINEYLKANKPQSEKLGGKVGGFVGGKVDEANQNLQKANEAFGQEVAKNTKSYDENLANEIRQNPNQISQDKNRVKQVQSLNQGYQGPTDIQTNQGFQAANKQALTAKKTADDLSNASGQRSVLENMQTEQRGGKINRGAATLDQSLLQASEGGKKAIQGVQQKAASIPQSINDTIAQAMQKVSGAQKTSEATKQKMAELYAQQFGSQKADLEGRVSKNQKEVNDRTNRIMERVASGNVGSLTNEDIAFLGTDKATLQSLMNEMLAAPGMRDQFGNVNRGELNKLFRINPQSSGIDINTVANAEDYARNAALAELSGQSGFLGDPSKSGQYNTDIIDFDMDLANQMLAPERARQAEYAKQAQMQAQLAAQQAEQARIAEQQRQEQLAKERSEKNAQKKPGDQPGTLEPTQSQKRSNEMTDAMSDDDRRKKEKSSKSGAM